MDEKRGYVKSVTDGRVESSSAMTYMEGMKLIRHLEDKQQPSNIDPADNMRKKIISMLREIGYETHVEGKRKADMKAIYSLVNKVGYLKKGFNQYTAQELPKLVSQIEEIYKKELRRVR